MDNVAETVIADFGGCDILVNGAGGNNPRATTDKEYYEPGDIDADIKSFFNLDTNGVEFVFNLNFMGPLYPEFCTAHGQYRRQHNKRILYERFYTPTKIPAYSVLKQQFPTSLSGLQYIFQRSASV